jgi:hypothetical protein
MDNLLTGAFEAHNAEKTLRDFFESEGSEVIIGASRKSSSVSPRTEVLSGFVTKECSCSIFS